MANVSKLGGKLNWLKQVDEDSTDERQGMEWFVIIPCTYDTGAEVGLPFNMASHAMGPWSWNRSRSVQVEQAWGAWKVEAAGGV